MNVRCSAAAGPGAEVPILVCPSEFCLITREAPEHFCHRCCLSIRNPRVGVVTADDAFIVPTSMVCSVVSFDSRCCCSQCRRERGPSWDPSIARDWFQYRVSHVPLPLYPAHPSES
eukprot:GHVU01006917.1.p1 GENE.GHVU01006917.1~~GHVU01006917.1.p1  ORF type:complete len:116 (+),score=1.21 GHVU01006917.1:585-932(+)